MILLFQYISAKGVHIISNINYIKFNNTILNKYIRKQQKAIKQG